MKFYINSNEREKYNLIYLFARERIIWRRRLENQVVRVSQSLPPQKSFVLETQENDGYFFLSSHIASSYLCYSHCTPTKGTILLLIAFSFYRELPLSALLLHLSHKFTSWSRECQKRFLHASSALEFHAHKSDHICSASRQSLLQPAPGPQKIMYISQLNLPFLKFHHFTRQ